MNSSCGRLKSCICSIQRQAIIGATASVLTSEDHVSIVNALGTEEDRTKLETLLVKKKELQVQETADTKLQYKCASIIILHVKVAHF